MENYETLGIIGEGTYGVVMKARHRTTGKLVAIKRFKQADEDDHVRKTSTREVRMLQQLKHPNVVRLEDVFRRDGKLYLVFEYIDNTILQVLEKTTHGIPPRDLRRYMYQLLRGIEFCHAHNVIHRDVKPENVLIDQSGMLKLCDFGFARQMTSKGKYTDYVATRWYRAPELLVGDVSYGKPVDVWALGCMFAELSDGQPLFPGESDLDQLCLIIQTCGPVPDRMVSIFEHNPLYRNVSYPQTGTVYTLQERYHHQAVDWLEFLYACLHPDPAKRLTCTELMALPYFTRDGFRERYEQELRAMSGLPLLRTTNPATSALSPTPRAGMDLIGGAGDELKSGSDKATLGLIATTASVGPTSDVIAPPSTKKHPPMISQKIDISKCGSMEAARIKDTGESGGLSLLPPVPLPASVPPEESVQLPTLLNQSVEKTSMTTATGAAGAADVLGLTAQEQAAMMSSPHRRHGNMNVPEAGASPTSNAESSNTAESLKGKQHTRREPFSQSCSAVLSSQRTSPASSLAVSPKRKAENIVIGSTSPESGRRLSNTMKGNAVIAAQLPNAGEEAAAAAGARGGTTAAAEVRRTSRTSRSSVSVASPRSSSLKSERSEAKLGVLSAAHSSALALSPSNMTDVVLKAASGQQQQQQQPHLTPLAERLPDLTSPQLHLPAHQKGGSVDTDEIPRPPSQLLYPTSPTSFNGSNISQQSLNPLVAAPAVQERGAGGRKHSLAKGRRNGGPHDTGDASSTYAKKKLTKRRKDGLQQRSSRDSSSRSTSYYNPQEQGPEGQRARGSAKRESASVSACKLSMTRSPSRVPQDARDEDEVLSHLLAEERANRMRESAASKNTSGSTRGSMPRKERRSKPLHGPANPATHRSGSLTRTSLQQQQQQQTFQPTLEALLQPESKDVAQRASATLMALSALRDSTAAMHKRPGDGNGSVPEKYPPFGRHTQALATGNGADYVVPPPPKTQVRENAASQTKKASSRSRKPLGVYTLQSTRRSLDEGEVTNTTTTTRTLHEQETNTLATLPSSQHGGLAMPYRRTSKTGSNGGVGALSILSGASGTAVMTSQQPTAKKSRKKRSSISGDANAGGSDAVPYAGGHLKSNSSSSRPPVSTAASTETSTPRRENSGSSKKLLPLMYNAVAATAIHM
jgi:cyclin-dependent kinase-like